MVRRGWGIVLVTAAITGCSSSRYLVMTPQSDSESWASLNRDLARCSTAVVILDTAFIAQQDSPSARFSYDQRPEAYGYHSGLDSLRKYGSPRVASHVTANRDTICFTAIESEVPTACPVGHVSRIIYNDESRAMGKAVLQGLGGGALLGAVAGFAIVSIAVGDSDWTRNDWETAGGLAAAGAAVGGLLGFSYGLFKPTVKTRTNVVFVR
jgi:hypothetical protein